jgi:hypothetical protein
MDASAGSNRRLVIATAGVRPTCDAIVGAAALVVMDDRVQPVQVFPAGIAGNLLNGQLSARLGEGTVDAGRPQCTLTSAGPCLRISRPANFLAGRARASAIAGHDATHRVP